MKKQIIKCPCCETEIEVYTEYYIYKIEDYETVYFTEINNGVQFRLYHETACRFSTMEHAITKCEELNKLLEAEGNCSKIYIEEYIKNPKTDKLLKSYNYSDNGRKLLW